MIPEEAIEAAALALRDKYAAEVTELPVSSFLGDAKTALEAAAPHMLTQAGATAAEPKRYGPTVDSGRPLKTIDLRGRFSYAVEYSPGITCRLYDVFNAGLLGATGDTIIWTTPQGACKGEVTANGWESLPLPTRWVDVVIRG